MDILIITTIVVFFIYTLKYKNDFVEQDLQTVYAAVGILGVAYMLFSVIL